MKHFFQLRTICKKIVLWFLIFDFIFQPVFVAAQSSEVIPDARQGKNPAVIQASNGVTLVNILAPNDKGLSHNQYLNLQVGPNGLIFNNQTGSYRTQLAGYIAGNPNLLNNSAKVILNEITGRLPTSINGYMEVAGRKADIIIANPNGIIGNNFGFINTARSVLTTGVPIIDKNGSLEKFHVNGGTVTIEGTGLNSITTDRVDIIARAVKVNAGIWTKDLHITTGANDVTYNDQVSIIEPAYEDNTKGIALDVAYLGGMYADKITLIGTEKGVGVNSQGNISAGSGALTLTQEGKIVLTGKTFSAGNIQINSKNALTQTGTSYAADNMDIMAANISNSGTIAAAKDMSLAAQDITSNGTLGAGVQDDGQLREAGNLNVTAKNKLTANGKNLAAGDMTMKAGAIDLKGASTFIGGQGNIAATAGDIDHTNGVLQSQKAISLSGKELKNKEGKINTNDDLEIKLSGNLQNEQGLLYAGKDLTANAAAIDNSGTIAAAKDMVINARDITSNGTLGAGVQGDGQLGEAGNLNVTAKDKLAANGKNLAAGDMTMKAGAIDLKGASTFIGGQGTIAAAAGKIDHTNGILQSQKAISLSGKELKNKDGKINANDSLTIKLSGALQNEQGLAYAAKDINISADNISNSGTIAAAKDIVINARDITSNGTLGAGVQGDGQLGEAGNLSVIAKDKLAANGKNLAAGDMTMKAGAIDLNGASTFIGGQGAIAAAAGDIDHMNGILQGKNTISLTARDLKNQGGKIVAAGNLDIKLNNNLENEGSLIYSGKNLNVSANSIQNMNTQNTNQGIEAQAIKMDFKNMDNAQGSLRAQDNLYLTGQQNINNEKGIISAGNLLSLQDNSPSNKNLFITNTQGSLLAGQQLQINSAGLSGDGKILSKGDINIKLTQNYTNTGELQAQGNADFYTAGTFTNQAEIVAGNWLTLHAANINNKADGKFNGQNTKLTADQILDNRGLIDGNETLVQANDLNNMGTGRIYGNHLAVQANTITNRAADATAPVIAAREQLDIAAGTIINQEHAKIFSAGDIRIGGNLDSRNQAVGQAGILQNNSAEIEALGNISLAAQKIYNTNEHFSTAIVEKTNENIIEYQGSGSPKRYLPGMPGVVIFNDESDHLRTPEGIYEVWLAYRYKKGVSESRILNSDPASIKSGGNLSIQSDLLNNDKSTIIAGGSLLGNIGSLNNIEASGQRITTGTGRVTTYWRDHHKGRDSTGCSTSAYNPAPVIETIPLESTVYRQGVTPTEPGIQIDKQNVSITAKATISSNVDDGDKEIIKSNLNMGEKGTVDSGVNVGDKGSVGANVNISDKGSAKSSVSIGEKGSAKSSVSMGEKGTVDSGVNVGDKGTIDSDANVADKGTVKGTISPIMRMTTPQGESVITGAVDSRIPDSSLFSVTPASNSKYLIETDPHFTNYRTWLSSDYMLKLLSYDPSIVQKRLGDGFYEQTLIRNQIAALTGNRYLSGYSNDEAQYQALMNNALAFAKENYLRVGQELSAEQMANLKTDMVWMVEKDILLPNGQIKRALVPQVYVHNGKDDENSPGMEGLISGNAVKLAVKDDLTNSGTIQGKTTVDIAADNVQNLLGNINGDNVNITANVDLNNIGGQIRGDDSISLKAGENITIASITSTQTNQQGSRTNLNSVAGLSLSGEQGKLTINAGQDVNLIAAEIQNKGKDSTTTIQAGQNLNLGTVKESQNNKLVWDNDNWRKDSMTADVGTRIRTPGAVSLQAGLDINAKAAAIQSDKEIELAAGRDINLTAGEVHQTVDEAHKHKGRSGGGASLTVTTRDTLDQTLSQGTVLSGGSVNMLAGQNLLIDGSKVVGTGDVTLKAGENIAISAAQETKTEGHMRQEKKSGILGSGFGFTIGTERQKNTVDMTSLTQAAGTVGSIQGNVNIQAGKDIKIQASDIISGQDTKILGRNVDVEAGMEKIQEQQSYEYKKSGLTVSIGSPTIDTLQSITNKVERANEVSDSRLSALYDIQAVRELKGLGQTIDKAIDGKTLGKDIGVNIGLGSTNVKQNSTSESLQAKGSQISAGRNVEIAAIGSNQKDGNVGIKGSMLSGENVSIRAAKDVTLESTENRTVNNTQNSGKAAGMGVRLSAGGSGIYVEGSKSGGIENGTALSHTPSIVTAKDTLKIESGKDTNILGSQASGNRVEIETGNDLNIASLQDIENYNAKNSSSGMRSGTQGNISKGKTASDYTSVTEQAGIYAGKDGFDITVGQNTDLKGAVISSEATPDKNKLSTGSLTYSDIENKAEYSSSSVGVNYDSKKYSPLDKNYKNQGITPAMGVSSSGNADSTTKSAIANGTIDIRSNPNQDISGLSRDTTNSLNALGKIFDKKTIEERQELAQIFGEEAFKAVGDLGLKTGSVEKAAVTAAVGSIMAKLGGSNFASGATGAGITEFTMNEIAKIKDPAVQQWVAYVIGKAAVSSVGGDGQTGGSVSVSKIRNNDYDPEHILQTLKDNPVFSAALLFVGYVVDQQNRILNKEGQVVASWSATVGGWVDDAGTAIEDLYIWAKQSGKEKANDVPSWAKGNQPTEGESGKDFAKRLMDEKYGEGNYDKGPGSEYNKIRKWGDRGFNK